MRERPAIRRLGLSVRAVALDTIALGDSPKGTVKDEDEDELDTRLGILTS
jgi:hypothetical protein